MLKPATRRIPSDDCVVTFGGESFRPHEGEWVDVFGKPTVAHLQILWDRQATGRDDPDGGVDVLMDVVAQYLAGWNWTGDRGEVLAQPSNGKAIKALHAEEVAYLLGVIQGETAEQRGQRIEGMREFLLSEGSEPYTAKLSRICEAFRCLPSDAEREDWATLQAIMEFRLAHRAAVLRETEKGEEQIGNSPALVYWDRVLSFGEDVARQMALGEDDS